MPTRLRRLLAAASLLGFLGGCAHEPRPRPRDLGRLTDEEPALRSEKANKSNAPVPAPVSRVTAPGTPYTRAQTDAPFAPLLLATTQVAYADTFRHAPDQATLGYRPAIRLYRGQTAFFLPFARNYGVDPSGRTDLTFELSILRPDGSTDSPSHSGVLWQNTVTSPTLTLFPATTVSFWTEPSDALGDYRARVRVHDHLAGQTRELIHPFTIVDYTPPLLPPNFSPQRWFDTYYQDPRPELALPALSRLFLDLPTDQRASALPPLLGFYDQILHDNPWLLPAFSVRLAAAKPDEAYLLSLVLGFHLRHAPATPRGLAFAAWTRLEDFRTHVWPADPERPLADAAQLDVLWGRFFASGLYAPVARLLAPLEHLEDLGAADRPAPLPPPSETPLPAEGELGTPETATLPPAARRDLLIRTTLWSLRRRSHQHPLIRAYLDWTLDSDALSPAQKDILQRVLASPDPAVTAK